MCLITVFNKNVIVLSVITFTICLFANLSCQHICSYNDDNNPLKLKSLLPQEYIANSPPNKSHPVYIGIEILDVDSVKDAENYFSLRMYLFEVWYDNRLNISNISATNESILVPNEYTACIWTPSLEFEASTQKDERLTPYTMVNINYDKLIFRRSRYSFNVRCNMNLDNYPMDKHHCLFKIRSFSESMSKVDLHWLAEQNSPFQDLLHKNKSVIKRNAFSASLFETEIGYISKNITQWLNENYTSLEVMFIFKRTMTASVLTVYIPSSLIVTLSWLQFWFDVEAVPGRMALGIMSILTLMTQILTNYEKAVNHVTAIDYWLFVCLIMVFLALMEYPIAYTISHYYSDHNLNQKSISKESENNIKKNTSSISLQPTNKTTVSRIQNRASTLPQESNEKFALIDKNDVNMTKALSDICDALQTQAKMLDDLRDKLDASSKSNTRLSKVDYVSRFVFPIAFVLFVLIYIMVYTIKNQSDIN